MTLVELIVALVLLTVIVGAALRTLHSQLSIFTASNERMDLLQNFRFAADILEQDIRTTGMGVPGHQPFLVYAGDDVIAFNADYATNDPHDLFAIYRRVDAPDSEVMALTEDRQIVIPGTSVTYPEATYDMGGVNSPAETIIFYFEEDPDASSEDMYRLMRQVNANDPELISRDLKQTEGEPFFEYLRLDEPDDGAPELVVVGGDEMPMHHSVPIHGSAEDTGPAAMIDDVRAVRIQFTATNGRSGSDEQESKISRLVRLHNAGLAVSRTCGDAPIMGTELDVRVIYDEDTEKEYVHLTWEQAIDEGGGEEDVVRYVLWRRPVGTTLWDETLTSLPAGLEEYMYDDKNVEPGTYEYAVAAQDCTPALSELVISPAVTIAP